MGINLDFVIWNFNNEGIMEKIRKPYKKPSLKQVKLVPEEAVLGVCKNDLGAGPNQSQCLIPQCFNNGS